jgi:hypothetical protein
VTGALTLRGTELSGEVDAASPRLAITATGRIAVTPEADSEVIVRFHDMSLDPYVRPFVPRLSPFTTAVASGSIRIAGRLTDVDHLPSTDDRHGRPAPVRLREERDADPAFAPTIR